MPSPRASKAKGSLFERQVADYLRDSGVFPSCERAPRWGSVDKGDLVGTGDFCLELKATKAIDLAGFLAEAEVEAQNADKEFPVVIIKRRMKSVEQAYVVMALEDWKDLVMERNAVREEAA